MGYSTVNYEHTTEHTTNYFPKMRPSQTLIPSRGYVRPGSWNSHEFIEKDWERRGLCARVVSIYYLDLPGGRKEKVTIIPVLSVIFQDSFSPESMMRLSSNQYFVGL